MTGESPTQEQARSARNELSDLIPTSLPLRIGALTATAAGFVGMPIGVALQSRPYGNTILCASMATYLLGVGTLIVNAYRTRAETPPDKPADL